MNDLSLQSGLNLPTYQKPRVAILVDGDNVPQTALAAIEATGQAMGETVIRRVYGDMALHKDWAAETTYLTIHCTTTAGKNRADIHLVIGAMDIAHRGLATHFVILSDDRDFGPLVSHLREIGMKVEWAGKPKVAPKPIIVPPVVAKLKAPSEVDKKLHDLLKIAKDGLILQALGSQMKNGGVKAQTGKTTWRAYLKSKPDLYILSGERTATIVTLNNR